MPSHKPFSSALNARCQGAISAGDFTGMVRVYAGTNTKLYRIIKTAVTDVSKAGGYATLPDVPWSFAVHGQRIIATNGIDPVQMYLEGTSSSFSNLITSGVTSLKAKYATIIKRWLFLANTNDSIYGNQPQRVWWSAINDPTNFPTPGTQLAANNLSDFQDQPGGHGAIRGIAGNLGTADGAVFFERAVWRIIYSGLPNIFDFVPAEGARGLLASGSLNQYGSQVAYLAEDGFYMFDGSNSLPIGKGKIDRFFLNDLQSNYLDRISSTSDPTRGLLIWAYPGVGSINGNPNRLLIYSQPFDKWTITDATSVQIEFLLRGATFAYSLEELDSFGNIDSLAFSLDSSVWLGGKSKLAAFDVNHQYGFFDGANLAATIDSTDIEPIPGQQSQLFRISPLVDSSLATCALASRNTINQAVVFGSDSAQEVNGSCAVNGRGRYHRIRIKVPYGTDWQQCSGVDLLELRAVSGIGI